MVSYGFKKEIELSHEESISAVTEALKQERFGVLTRIDLHEKFKEKLGIDFPNYTILGACNPHYAHRALEEEEDIGLLLPCNVVVYEKGDATVVTMIKPSIAMGMIDNPNLVGIAEEVETALKRAIDSL